MKRTKHTRADLWDCPQYAFESEVKLAQEALAGWHDNSYGEDRDINVDFQLAKLELARRLRDFKKGANNER